MRFNYIVFGVFSVIATLGLVFRQWSRSFHAIKLFFLVNKDAVEIEYIWW